MNILLIDNYDSFTFNLAHQLSSFKKVILTIKRNDAITLEEIAKKKYQGIVISPGPGCPSNQSYFGNNLKIIKNYGVQNLPILGVCLGFQGIFYCFGGTLKQAPCPMHGKVSQLEIVANNSILAGIPNGTNVMRYHSIMADLSQPLPSCLEYMAYARDPISNQKNGRELMAIRHKKHPIFGVQFHPESFATTVGNRIIKNFIEQIQNYQN